MKARWAIAAAFVAAILASYTGFWFIAAGEIRGAVENWAEERRAEGYEVSFARPEISGFPLLFRVDFADPALALPEHGWSWRGEALQVVAPPCNPYRVRFHLSGRHELSFFQDGQWAEYFGAAEQVSASFAFDDEGRTAALELEISNLEIGGETLPGPARVERLWILGPLDRPADPDHRTEVAELSIRLANLSLPPGTNRGLGDEIERLSLEVSLKGPLPDGELGEALRHWRDAGGTVELEMLAIRWGPVGLEADGTLALDHLMRPLGALTVKVIGYGDVIDALVKNGIVPLGEAFIYKVAFDLIARKPEAGGPPVLTVPLTVQDGGLSVGPMTILDLPPLVPAETSGGAGNTP